MHLEPPKPRQIPKITTIHGYTLEELYERRYTPAFRAVMQDAVQCARKLFRQGLPLSRIVDKRLEPVTVEPNPWTHPALWPKPRHSGRLPSSITR